MDTRVLGGGGGGGGGSSGGGGVGGGGDGEGIELLSTLRGHAGKHVWCVAATSGGAGSPRLLASGGADGAVKLWPFSSAASNDDGERRLAKVSLELSSIELSGGRGLPVNDAIRAVQATRTPGRRPTALSRAPVLASPRSFSTLRRRCSAIAAPLWPRAAAVFGRWCRRVSSLKETRGLGPLPRRCCCPSLADAGTRLHAEGSSSWLAPHAAQPGC